jgi:hypothetical protein
LPAILRDISTSNSSLACWNILLARAWSLRERLLPLNAITQELLLDPSLVTKTSSLDPMSPFQMCYRFRNVVAAERLWFHWRLTIVIDSLILRLLRNPAEYTYTKKAMEATSLAAAENIAMSVEDAYRWKHICSLSMPFSLPAAIWAYSLYGTDEQEHCHRKEWVRKAQQRFAKSMNRSWMTVCIRYHEILGIVSATHSADDQVAYLWPNGSFSQLYLGDAPVECPAC